MCLNGGALHLCDHCPRAVCHQCLPPLPDIDVSNLDFLCLACHEVIFKRSHLPYYVSPRVLYYLSDSLPLLAGLLCEADVRSQWKTGTFSLETWHRWSHESARAISNDLSIPSQHGRPSHSSFHSPKLRRHWLPTTFAVPIYAGIHPCQWSSL